MEASRHLVKFHTLFNHRTGGENLPTHSPSPQVSGLKMTKEGRVLEKAEFLTKHAGLGKWFFLLFVIGGGLTSILYNERENQTWMYRKGLRGEGEKRELTESSISTESRYYNLCILWNRL